MGRTVETLSTINSMIRTALGVAIVGGLGWAGWLGYSVYDDHTGKLKRTETELADAQAALDEKDNQLAAKEAAIEEKDTLIAEQDATILTKNDEIADLNDEVAAKAKEIEKLDTAIRLLKVDRRLAKITVIAQEQAADSDMVYTTIEFVETNEAGEPIDEPKQFRIKGDVVYIDYWVVKFEDEYVEEADILRATSLCLFRRIFGERQQPMEGFLIDEVGSRPKAYSDGEQIGEFEKRIWDDFWNIANDEQKARDLGIRAAHGEAVSTKLREGKQYRLMLRASDGLSITPAEDAPVRPGRPAT